MGPLTMPLLGAMLLVLFLAACGGASTITPSPTGSTPKLITVSPEEDPAGFLSAMPKDERDCLEQAVGSDKLEDFISSNDPGDEILEACISEETLRAVIFGQTTRQAGGLADDTVSCLFDDSASLNFPNMVFGEASGPDIGVFMQVIALCLSDDELLRSQGFVPGDARANAEQVRCSLLLNPRPIASEGQVSPELRELFDSCDGQPGLLGESALLSALSLEDEACLIEAIGEGATRDVIGGQRSFTIEEVEAIRVCYASGSENAPIPPGIEFPDFETLPEISAPMELNTVAWPSSVEDASALLERLPDEIAGHRLTERHGESGAFRTDFNFGEDPGTDQPVLAARVLDLPQGGFFPADTTAGNLVAFFAQGFDWEVLAAGRDGSLAWVRIKTTGTTGGVTRDIYGLLWGDALSSAVFNAQANNPEELAVVVQAIVIAAR